MMGQFFPLGIDKGGEKIAAPRLAARVSNERWSKNCEVFK